MVAVSQPLPEIDDAPPGAKKGWEQQIGMSLKCLTGDDAGLEARFTTTSVGGKRGVQTIAAALAEQVEKDQTKPVPVVTLKRDHYQHKSYGKIYTPVFEIVDWNSMEGEPEVAAPAGRRRRVAAA